MKTPKQLLDEYKEYRERVITKLHERQEIVSIIDIFTLQSAYTCEFKDYFKDIYKAGGGSCIEISELIVQFIHDTEKFERTIVSTGIELFNVSEVLQ